jgi:fructokinase
MPRYIQTKGSLIVLVVIIIGDVFFDVSMPREIDEPLNTAGINYCDKIAVSPGGTGNIAVGLRRLGAETFFIGKAGHDMLGTFYKKDLHKEGVLNGVLYDKNASTGVVIVQVCRNGERSFLVSRGANSLLKPNEINHYSSTIAGSQCLFVTGCSLVDPPQKDAILSAVQIAKTHFVTTILDLGAYNIVSENRATFNTILQYIDILSANLDEAKALTMMSDINDIIIELRKRFLLTALRLGERGCIMIGKRQLVRCPTNLVNCIDTTGAGDAFDAALIYGLLNRFNLNSIAKLANWYASRNVRGFGPRYFPDKEEIHNFLSHITQQSSTVSQFREFHPNV